MKAPIKDIKNFSFNRPISEKNVKEKMDSISHFGFIGKIIVHKGTYETTGFYYVLDGQHRVEAMKRLGKEEIPIELLDGDPLEIITRLNHSQKQWKQSDYISAYAKHKVQFYMEVEKLAEEYAVGLTVAFTICLGKQSHGTKELKSGKNLPLNAKRIDVFEFLKEIDVPYKHTLNFVRAAVRLYVIANDEQVDKLKAKIQTIVQQVNQVDYLACFQNIINHKTRANNKISLIQN